MLKRFLQEVRIESFCLQMNALFDKLWLSLGIRHPLLLKKNPKLARVLLYLLHLFFYGSYAGSSGEFYQGYQQ